MKARTAAQEPLVDALLDARRVLLEAAALLPDRRWKDQPSKAYSPIGWHVGHVAATQARWLLPGEPTSTRFGSFFDPFRTPKETRTRQPTPAELRAYLDEVSTRVCKDLRAGRLPGILGLPETFLVHHIVQHELQHAEHVRIVAALCEGRLHRGVPPLQIREAGRVRFPGGQVRVGCDDAAIAADNERPPHVVELQPYWLDRAPVTVGDFRRFVAAGGYRKRVLWTEQGWEWREKDRVEAPVGFDEQPVDSPVTCVSWFEADAYARFAGARLPSEHELEAAGFGPSGVWEWTSSWFEPYPGFRPYPYEGYSKPWFGTHRVLRGGSWASPAALLRPSFRNWYEPSFRELPSGFRCAGGM